MANIRREIAEGLGDVAREGIERLVKRADDGGWKGGKPGEITGTMWRKMTRGLESGKVSQKDYEAFLERAYNQFSGRSVANKPVGRYLRENMDKQRADWMAYHSADTFPEMQVGQDIAETMLGQFYMLEKAGVPRSLTGKLQPYVNQLTADPRFLSEMVAASPRMRSQLLTTGVKPSFSDFNEEAASRAFAKLYGKHLVGFTGDDVETLFRILPRWSGTFEEAASAAKKLYRR